MPSHMILDKAVVPARFNLDKGAGEALPLTEWLERNDKEGNTEKVGVIIEGDERIESLQPHLEHVPFVALHLPKWTDGRIYSHARRIRTLWAYEGVILVFGDVLRDQLLYMSRSGVNGFYMRDDQDLQASLAAFSLYTEHYQYNA
jgi:uncharacterized protein (DUF934 family)